MNQFLKKIASILMAFVVFFSTMSFTISEHYCGGDLVNTSMFIVLDSCEVDMQMRSASEDCNLGQEDCCSDIIKIVEGQNELKTQLFNLNFEQQVFVASFVYAYINLFEGLDTNAIPSKNYSTPIYDKDFNVLYQTFLI